MISLEAAEQTFSKYAPGGECCDEYRQHLLQSIERAEKSGYHFFAEALAEVYRRTFGKASS